VGTEAATEMISVLSLTSGAISFQHFGDDLGLYAQQNNVRALGRFAIVVGDRYAELLGNGCSLFGVLDRGGDALGGKETLLEVGAQQNATKFACAEHSQSLVGKFGIHQRSIVPDAGCGVNWGKPVAKVGHPAPGAMEDAPAWLSRYRRARARRRLWLHRS